MRLTKSMAPSLRHSACIAACQSLDRGALCNVTASVALTVNVDQITPEVCTILGRCPAPCMHALPSNAPPRGRSSNEAHQARSPSLHLSACRCHRRPSSSGAGVQSPGGGGCRSGAGATPKGGGGCVGWSCGVGAAVGLGAGLGVGRRIGGGMGTNLPLPPAQRKIRSPTVPDQ